MTKRYRFPLRSLSLLIGVACSGAGVASAQQPVAATSAEPPPPSPGNVAQAREEFTLGATLAHRGDWLDALAAFERSDQLRPHPITVYNIGYCERALGRYTRAWKAFRRALADNQAKRGGTMPPEMVEQTREYIKEVEGRLARAFVTIDQDGVELSVNGRPLELVENGPGKHRVLVAGTRAPGRPEAAPGRTFEVLLDPGNQVFLLEHNSMQATVVDRSFEAGSSTSFRLHIRPPVPEGTAARSQRRNISRTTPGPSSRGASVRRGWSRGRSSGWRPSRSARRCAPRVSTCAQSPPRAISTR